MGTNYYVHSEYRDGWHLGKRSAGWPFLFHAQNNWDPRRFMESWLETLSVPGARIEDEYGREIGFSDFMLMIIDTYDKYEHQVHPRSVRDGRASRFQFMYGEFC